MDEKEFAAELAEAALMLQVEDNLDQFAAYCQQHQERISQAFCHSFQTLFQKGLELQAQGRLGPVAYLAIAVLRTLLMEGCYQLRLDLYDASYFLSKIECSAYLDLEYLFKYIDTDINGLIADLKECGGKYPTYEIDNLKKEYISVYAAIAQAFLVQNLPAILGLAEYKLLKKTADFKIIYGEYLDRTAVIYDAAASSGAGPGSEA